MPETVLIAVVESKSIYNTHSSIDKTIVVILFAFLCLSTLYFSFRYGGFRLFVNFSDVYQYRLFGERMTSIGFYIFNWNKNVALPITFIMIFLRMGKNYS